MTPYVGLRTSPQLLIPARMHGNGIKRSRSSAICTLCLVSTHFATKVHHLASSFVVFDFFSPPSPLRRPEYYCIVQRDRVGHAREAFYLLKTKRLKEGPQDGEGKKRGFRWIKGCIIGPMAGWPAGRLNHSPPHTHAHAAEEEEEEDNACMRERSVGGRGPCARGRRYWCAGRALRAHAAR